MTVIEKQVKPTTGIETIHKQTAELEDRAGILGRISAGRKISRDSANALAEINKIATEATVSVAATSIGAAATLVNGEIVANIMPRLGDVLTSVNQQMTVVDQTLTNSFGAELHAHMQNRKESFTEISNLVTTGSVDDQEAEQLMNMINKHTVDNIARSEKRLNRSKNTLETLHGIAAGGVKNIAEQIENH